MVKQGKQDLIPDDIPQSHRNCALKEPELGT